MNIIRLIDNSGSMRPEDWNDVISKIQVGDRVIYFDTLPHDMGIMTTQDEIIGLPRLVGGGTSIKSSLEYIAGLSPKMLVHVYTDGYIGDFRIANDICSASKIRILDITTWSGSYEYAVRDLRKALGITKISKLYVFLSEAIRNGFTTIKGFFS